MSALKRDLAALIFVLDCAFWNRVERRVGLRRSRCEFERGLPGGVTPFCVKTGSGGHALGVILYRVSPYLSIGNLF